MTKSLHINQMLPKYIKSDHSFANMFFTNDEPNIIIQLLTTYFSTEQVTTITLIILSLIVNGIQAHGISRISAEMVQSVENNNKSLTSKIFTYLCLAFFLFLLLNLAYKYLQNRLLIKMRQWIRHTMLKLLLDSNKENMDEINYPRISSPINRTASELRHHSNGISVYYSA